MTGVRSTSHTRPERGGSFGRRESRRGQICDINPPFSNCSLSQYRREDTTRRVSPTFPRQDEWKLKNTFFSSSLRNSDTFVKDRDAQRLSGDLAKNVWMYFISGLSTPPKQCIFLDITKTPLLESLKIY